MYSGHFFPYDIVVYMTTANNFLAFIHWIDSIQCSVRQRRRNGVNKSTSENDTKFATIESCYQEKVK